MKKIIFPLKLQMQGSEVADLQAVLELLVDRGVIRVEASYAPALDKRSFQTSVLASMEFERSRYSGITQLLVRRFQEQHSLPVTGQIDEATAQAINDFLRELGVLEESDKELFFVVNGQVKTDTENPFKGGLVRAFHREGDKTIRLGEDTTDGDGQFTIRYPALPAVTNINLRVTASDKDGNLLQTSDVEHPAKPVETVNLVVKIVVAETFQVKGRVGCTFSASVGGLQVKAFDKAVATIDMLLDEAITDDNGNYQITFTNALLLNQRSKAKPDLQVRVFANDTLLATSEIRYNVSNSELINVLIKEEPTSTTALRNRDARIAALKSEHETLTSAISSHFNGRLNQLQETDEHQDISHLAHKTGWDARAVALAALADRASERSKEALATLSNPEGEETDTKIDPEFFYALFRAGLPANNEDNLLYQYDVQTVEDVWKQAIDQGVIPATLQEKIEQTKTNFQRIAVSKALDDEALVGISSLKQMLETSLSKQYSEDKEAFEAFAKLYNQHRNNPDELWRQVQADNKLKTKYERLKIDGQLGYLTINNANLIAKIHEKSNGGSLTDLSQLATGGYYNAAKWKELIADRRANIPIPPEIPGENEDEKKTRYAEMLAAQVRLSYPTLVVAQMVQAEETPLQESALKNQVHQFLTDHREKFEIGMQPIAQYIKKYERENNRQITPEEARAVKEITRIQRVYQITPGDKAMNALLASGVDSAYAVTRYQQQEFIDAFKDRVGSETNAQLIYSKAQQVHNTVLNIAVSYLTASNAPGIGVHSSPRYINPMPGRNNSDGTGASSQDSNASDVIAYPTLEGLFGEMDYCACEHCRSILSPAAYLVDLLQFIDLKRYNSQGQELAKTYEKENPLDVLLRRRPDIEHLPLTCENTNTPLPYIDLVNEVLEYYVTNNSLDNYTGHTIDGSTTSEELLANPQFVSDQAYAILAGNNHPQPLLPPASPLPFHQPLENLRRYFNKFEAPLPLVMEALRQNDNVDRAKDQEYGWRDIWMEELGLSRAEYKLLSDRSLSLQQLYGYPSGTQESDVLGGFLVGIRLNASSELDQGKVPQELKNWLSEHGKTLSDKAQLTVKKAGSSWTIVDTFTYDIRKEEQNLNVYLIGLSNAKAFTRRIGLSYEELIEILKTRFINPNSTLIPKVEKLGVSFLTLKQFMDGGMNGITPSEFDKRLASNLDPAQYGGDIKAWVKNQANYDKIMGLLTLASPFKSDDLCSFDQLEFRYANPDNTANKARAFEFIRLFRFIRLWKKLGWTIEQTDKAITALYPADKLPNNSDSQKLDEGFLVLLPRLGIVKRVMDVLKLNSKRDLLPLLSCFAPIDTHGAKSLYRQMFLNPVMLKQDPIFADDGYGNFLQKVEVTYTHVRATLEQSILDAASKRIAYDHSLKLLSFTGVLSGATRDALKTVPGVDQTFGDAIDALYHLQLLISHAEALRAAFGLTHEEFSNIFTDLRFNPDTSLAYEPSAPESANYSVENISKVFRRGWLARALKLSVPELLQLIKVTGLDPFAALEPANPSILRLINLVNRLRELSFKPSQALYLIWNIDLSGKSTPDNSEILGFARTLRSSFAAIKSEFNLIDDPDGQIARTRMSQVYGNEATELFFGLLNNTIVTRVDYSHEPVNLRTTVRFSRQEPVNLLTTVPYEHEREVLEEPIVVAGQRTIHYDPTLKQLSFDGTLTEPIRNALKEVLNVTDKFKAAVDSLYSENQKVIEAQLEQPILQAGQGLIKYDDTRKELSFNGTLTAAIRNALKAVPGVTDKFKAAVDSLYAVNQQIVKANLEQAIVAATPGLITYDGFRKQLSFTGVLSERYREALKNVAGVPQTFKNAVDSLYEVSQKVIEPFFNRYSELQPLYEAYKFFERLSSSVTYTQSEATLEANILRIAPNRLTYDPNREQIAWRGVLPEALRDELKKVPGVTPQFVNAVHSLCAENQTQIKEFFDNHLMLAIWQKEYLIADNIPERMRSVLLANFLPELKDRRKNQQALQSISASTKVDIVFAEALLSDSTVLHAVADPTRPALLDLKSIEMRGLSVQFFFGNTIKAKPDLERESEDNLSYGEDKNPLIEKSEDTSDDPISGIWRGYLEAPENAFYNLKVETDADATVELILDGETIDLQKQGILWSTRSRIEWQGGTLHAISLTVKNVKKAVKVYWETSGRGKEIIPAQYLYSHSLIEHLRETYIRFLKATSLAYALKLSPTEIAYLTCASADQAVKRVTYCHPQAALEQSITNVAPNQITYNNQNNYLSFTGSLIPEIRDALKVASNSTLASQAAKDAFNHAVDKLYILSQGWLNYLSVNDEPDSNTSAALLQAFSSLLDFARIKAALAPQDERLLAVFKDPQAKTQKRESLLFNLARWDEDSLKNLLAQFGIPVEGLADINVFSRLYDAFSWVKKLGISASALLKTTTNEPNATTVRDLQAALRARYAQSDWLTVLKPINDEMRGLQRDALVAYILHQMRSAPTTAHINTPDKLFEYFLMDVQMEPCMQTSRIRHALSSVQLFIERCLMNLETEVAPKSIVAKQWEWRKRYRVWEANRKVFLYPENWLEPELRDKQSPFFKETMSELLQGDITEDRAATALINYLSKLEEVAKLEPCGMHVEEESKVVHVVARTAGANRKYFYRRLESDGWTPWEQIKLDIEDNPVLPVVWKGRLFLFWLRILEQMPMELPKEPSKQNLTKTVKEGKSPVDVQQEKTLSELNMTDIKKNAAMAENTTKVTVKVVICWSEYYNGKWQPTKTSDVNNATRLCEYVPHGGGTFDRSRLHLYAFEEKNCLRINFRGQGASSFLLYNTFSLPKASEKAPPEIEEYYQLLQKDGTRYLDNRKGTLTANYQKKWNPETLLCDFTSPILSHTSDYKIDFSLLESQPQEPNPWNTSFFYEDSRHVFYITTSNQTEIILNGYAFTSNYSRTQPNIPPTVMDPIVIVPDKVGPIESGRLIIRNLNSSLIERFVSEDAYIHRGISNLKSIQFDGRAIGVSGSLTN